MPAQMSYVLRIPLSVSGGGGYTYIVGTYARKSASLF